MAAIRTLMQQIDLSVAPAAIEPLFDWEVHHYFSGSDHFLTLKHLFVDFRVPLA